MGVRKGTDNFREHRDAKTQSNLRLIRDELERARKRKLPYPNLSVLVADISDRTQIHRTTLTRNAQYRKVLLDYLAMQPGAAATVPDKDASPEMLRAKVLELRLELTTLRRRVATLEAQASSATETPAQLPSTHGTQGPAEQPDWYLAFSNTAILLRLVLDRLNGEFEVIRVDIDTGEILELSAAPGRQLIASGDRTRAFIEFYRKLLAQEGKRKDSRR